MKVAITAKSNSLDAQVDPRFGRAEYFVIYDKATNTWDCLSNMENLEAVQGAGIQAAQNLLKTGADIVITGYVGPKAFKVLEANGIDIYSVGTTTGTVQEALAAFQSGVLTKLTVPNSLEIKR